MGLVELPRGGVALLPSGAASGWRQAFGQPVGCKKGRRGRGRPIERTGRRRCPHLLARRCPRRTGAWPHQAACLGFRAPALAALAWRQGCGVPSAFSSCCWGCGVPPALFPSALCVVLQVSSSGSRVRSASLAPVARGAPCVFVGVVLLVSRRAPACFFVGVLCMIAMRHCVRARGVLSLSIKILRHCAYDILLR